MGPSISVLAVEVGFAGALVCLGSLMWFALAVRGRRAGRHPACRGCGFDLTGLLPGAATCPECGRSLAEPKSIVVGRRVRSAWSIGLAAMLLLASSGVLGTLWAARVSRAGWNSYKPAWMLADEADSADAARASAALLELGNRLRAGTLSGSRTQRLIRHALGVQADPARPWRAEWGDLIDLSISKHLVSAEQRKGYYEHMAASAVSMRRRHVLLADHQVAGSHRAAGGGR